MAILVGTLLLLMLMGAPLFAVIVTAAMLGFHTANVDLTVIAVELYRLVDTPMLLTLPLFTFTGYMMSESKTSERLLRLTEIFFGWLPSGLAVVAICACAAFTALTGASGITIVALGALLLPSLLKSKYPENYSLGLVTTSGSLGLLLPPSIPLILYGIVVQQMDIGQQFSLEQLFMAGLLPGLLMIFMLACWTMWSQRHIGLVSTPFSFPAAKTAIFDAAWEIPLPFFIFAGIFSGFLAVSEVAAVSALYVLIIETFVYREIELKALPRIIADAMQMVGGILLILGVSMAFTNFLIDAEIPARLLEWIKSSVNGKLSFLFFLNIFLLLLGAILDIFSALIIVVPLIVPIAIGYGIHPIHLGIIFLANMQIGYFTPPVGMNLFIASYRFNRSVTELYHAAIPFMLILLIALVFITYVPSLSLWFIQ